MALFTVFDATMNDMGIISEPRRVVPFSGFWRKILMVIALIAAAAVFMWCILITMANVHNITTRNFASTNYVVHLNNNR